MNSTAPAPRPPELDDPAFVLRYLASIGHAFTREGKVHKGICPFHGDTDPSLAVHDDGGLYCYGCGWAGSILDYVIERAGGQRTDKADIHRAFVTLGLSTAGRPFTLPALPAHFATPPESEPPPPQRAPDRVHPWHNHAGELVMQKRRWYLTADERPRYRNRDKVIRPYTPDGRIGEPKGGDLALYGWPALVTYFQDETKSARLVYVVESESDADAVNERGGLCVATGGSQRWRDAWGPDLAGRALVLLPHNDDAGRQWAAGVIRQTRAHAATIRRLDLPGLPEHGDVRDFLAAHTLDALDVLAAFVAPLPTEPPAICGELREMLDQVTAERDALREWRANVEAILDKPDLAMTDRVGLLVLQRISETLPPGEEHEVSQQEWAAQYGVPSSTMSRWLDRWDAMGLVKHRAGPDPRYPVVDRHGQQRYTPRGVPMYQNRTHLACNAAPFEVVATVTSPVMSKSGLRHGGNRICPNPACEGVADDQEDFHGKRCKRCGTVYRLEDRATVYQAAPAAYSQDESSSGPAAPGPYSQSEDGKIFAGCTMAVDAPPDPRALADELRRQAGDNPRRAGDVYRARARRHRADQDADAGEYAHRRATTPNMKLEDTGDGWCEACEEPHPCLCDVAGRDGPVTRAAPALVGARR